MTPRASPLTTTSATPGRGTTLIIYGHNMGKGQTARFSSLQNYRHPDYYTRHPVIELDTPEGSALYKIAAVYALSARPEDGDYFDFNRHVEFADEADRQRYLDEVAARSFYTAGRTAPPRRAAAEPVHLHLRDGGRPPHRDGAASAPRGGRGTRPP